MGHIEEVLDVVISKSPDGAGIQDIADSMGIGYQAARRYLAILHEKNRIKTIPYDYNSRIKKYVVGVVSRSPTVPHWNVNSPNVLVKVVAESLVYSNLNDQANVVQSKRLGYYISRLLYFAVLWDSEPGAVTKDQIANLQEQMENARSRAMWQVKVYTALLDNKTMWNPLSAPTLWFKDSDVEFTPEQAEIIYNQALLQHGESDG